MKNILLKSTILIIALLFSACGAKVGFKKDEPLDGAALVYVYVPTLISSGDSSSTDSYKIRINNKRVDSKIFEGEYKVFNLKPDTISMSVTKGGIEERTLKIDFKAGQIYYLRVVNDLENNLFSFTQVDSTEALKELSKTGLSGSKAIELDNIITEFMEKEPKQEEVVQVVAKPVVPVVKQIKSEPVTTSSKMDELKKAHQLKVDGILTEDEFKKLKAEILAK